MCVGKLAVKFATTLVAASSYVVLAALSLSLSVSFFFFILVSYLILGHRDMLSLDANMPNPNPISNLTIILPQL